ncbi:MAG: ABC transporter ATP-binding protein [Chloroflexota bacterium]|nr:ABC transporter ATP-binding protein [Chloroflexota bacterium]
MDYIPPYEVTLPLLKTVNLTKSFGTLTAVKDLNLEIMRGDVFGFLGPNGSGKTTTVRMLLGLLQPTAGSISIFGLDTRSHLSSILARLGAIVEAPVFYPYLSGIDNLRRVAAASNMRPGKSSQRRIHEVLETMDLQRQARDAYHTYSLGMKQRLGIGAALLTDPELILLDEPTNGLDPEGVHEMRQMILHLAKLGKTIFLSSHLLSEVQQVCNRVAILYRGNLIRQGTVSELLREGSQIVVGLDTPEKTQQALRILQQANIQGATWIRHVHQEVDKQRKPVLHVEAPAAHASAISELLARQQLFVAQMYPYQVSLETFFLEQIELSSERGSLLK